MKLTLFSTLALAIVAFLVVEVRRIGDEITVAALESQLQDAKERRDLYRQCRIAWPRNQSQQRACMEGLPE